MRWYLSKFSSSTLSFIELNENDVCFGGFGTQSLFVDILSNHQLNYKIRKW